MYKINLDLANKIYFAIKELEDDVCNYKIFPYNDYLYMWNIYNFLYKLEEKTKINWIKLQIYIKFLQDNWFVEIEKHAEETIKIKINDFNII
jgi:hypothetical protein